MKLHKNEKFRKHNYRWWLRWNILHSAGNLGVEINLQKNCQSTSIHILMLPWQHSGRKKKRASNRALLCTSVNFNAGSLQYCTWTKKPPLCVEATWFCRVCGCIRMYSWNYNLSHMLRSLAPHVHMCEVSCFITATHVCVFYSVIKMNNKSILTWWTWLHCLQRARRTFAHTLYIQLMPLLLWKDNISLLSSICDMYSYTATCRC